MKINIYVTFDADWINGYLSRGGERWGTFRKELLAKLNFAADGKFKPCLSSAGGVYRPYSIYPTTWRHDGDSPPRGAYSKQAKEAKRIAAKVVQEHMASYTFRYQHGEKPPEVE